MTISLDDPVNGTVADANLIAFNNNILETEINGGLTNANINASANIAGSKLADNGITNAKLVPFSGVLATMPPGRELHYNEFTADVTVSATSEATATTVVSASAAFTFDNATPVIVEFFAPRVLVSANANDVVNFALYDGAASIGIIGGLVNVAAVAGGSPVHLFRRLTPSAAAHTYSIRAWRTTANGTVNAGAGGLAAFMPGYIRIVVAR